MILVISMSFLLRAPAFSSDTYKWIDPEKGHPQFGDAPPPGVKYEVITAGPQKAPSSYSDRLGAQTQARQALELLDKSQKFYEAARLASSTARIALATPVATLQRIKQETESIEATGCLSPAKDDTVTAMNYCIESFIKFMSKESSRSSNSLCDIYFTFRDVKLTACIEEIKKTASSK